MSTSLRFVTVGTLYDGRLLWMKKPTRGWQEDVGLPWGWLLAGAAVLATVGYTVGYVVPRVLYPHPERGVNKPTESSGGIVPARGMYR